MKKSVQLLNTQESSPLGEKQHREHVWCTKYGYFIDLDACRARALQQKHCRRCYASLIQMPLPF
jgi:hypothetical protein